MKIIVGSQNAAKIAAVREGVGTYWDNAEVAGMDADSGVSAQPIGMEETRQGAVNRARAAFAAGADLGIGLEGGVADFGGYPMLFGVVAVFDGKQEVAVFTCGTPLPHAWGDALKAGQELGPYIMAQGLPYAKTTGTTPLLTDGKVLREENFTMGVKCALAPWVTPQAYAELAVAA